MLFEGAALTHVIIGDVVNRRGLRWDRDCRLNEVRSDDHHLIADEIDSPDFHHRIIRLKAGRLKVEYAEAGWRADKHDDTNREYRL